MQKPHRLLVTFLISLFCPLVLLAGPVHEFVAGFDAQPVNPSAGTLVPGGDGYFWGMTTNGGAYGNGAIYKVKLDGTDWQIVRSFSDKTGATRGRAPAGGLVSDGAGFLWGTTKEGGIYSLGTVFKIEVSTGNFTTVTTFNDTTVKGKNPVSTLVLSGGYFWGTTLNGGASNRGTIFKINAGSNVLSTVLEFTGTTVMGGYPYGALLPDGAGALWGTTNIGGASNLGTVFKIDAATGTVTTMAHLSATTGTKPECGLVSNGAGSFWGTATAGGVGGFGTIYKIDATTGAFTKVVDFADNAATNKGKYPAAPLVDDGAGKFWGTTKDGPGSSSAYGTLFSISTSAGPGATITTAFNFSYNTGTKKGAYTRAGLTVAAPGVLLGTTPSGGNIVTGTVYRFEPGTGAYVNLLDFDFNPRSNKGTSPYGALVAENADKLWTVTVGGGAKLRGTVSNVDLTTGKVAAPVEFVGTVNPVGNSTGSLPYNGMVSDGLGYFWGTAQTGGTGGDKGTIFKVNAATGEHTTVVNLTGTSGAYKGEAPAGGLYRDGAVIWGTTVRGGALNYGTIFKIDPTTGSFTTMVEFTGDAGPSKGAYPYGVLTKSSAGFLWGTTERGGTTEPDNSLGQGTVFKLSAGATPGTPVTTIAEFVDAAPAIGSYPIGGLVSDGAGYMWGTTRDGGSLTWGTVFKVAESAAAGSGVTTVIEFARTGTTNRGANPLASMMLDGGILWGTTNLGGSALNGSVFKIAPGTHVLTTVIDFTGVGTQAGAGSAPGYGALLKHADGNFYGTTTAGGPGGAGTIYRLRYGPSPVTQPASAVTTTSGTLNGTINPNGNVTTVSFEWGTNPQLIGASTVSVGVSSAGTTPEAFALPVSGLIPGVSYYYRIIGSNAENPVLQKGLIRALNEAPVVRLLGSNPMTFEAGPVFTEPGAVATDAEEGWLTPTIFSNNVNLSVPGTYSIVWRATDSLGIMGSATRIVNVVDTTKPVVIPPPDQIFEATGPTGAIINYPPATVTDWVGVTSVTYTYNSGTLFAITTRTVAVTARDAANNIATATFQLTVRDSTPPVVTPPADVYVNAASPTGAIVNFNAATATDAVGVTSIAYSQASGTLFPIGTTAVTVTAQDAAANAGLATFNVHVGPILGLPGWRWDEFGTIENLGIAADTADPDHDGVPNFMEFARHTDPLFADVPVANATRVGSNLEYVYVRSKSAVNAGASFLVEWNASPVTTGWSTAGVTQMVMTEDATSQTVKAVVPFGAAGHGFVRLRVIQ